MAGSIQTRDALFDVPLKDYTGARNALVRALTERKDLKEAAAVRALPKPKPSAWALNQLVRQSRSLVTAFFLSARQFQKPRSSGGEALRSELREAAAALRAELDGLVGRAERLLKDAGLPASVTSIPAARGSGSSRPTAARP